MKNSKKQAEDTLTGPEVQPADKFTITIEDHATGNKASFNFTLQYDAEGVLVNRQYIAEPERPDLKDINIFDYPAYLRAASIIEHNLSDGSPMFNYLFASKF